MSVRQQPITLRELAAGSITGSYQALGTPISQNLRVRYVKNQTNQTVYVSEDGVNDHHKLLAGETKTTDITANKTREGDVALGSNTQFYVKHAGSSPTTEAVVIEGDYID